MSNRTKPTNRPGPAGANGDKRRNLLVILAVVAVVVVVGIVAALAASENEASDAPSFGPVKVQGTILTRLPDGAPDSAEDPVIGQVAPRVEGVDADGEAVVLGEAGEPTIAFFLAHWCPHCQREVPQVVELMEDGALDGIRVVGVLTGTDSSRPNHPPVAWLEREGWQGEILLDDEKQSAAEAYGLTGYPFAVYLDADGEVVARTSGERGRDGILALADAIRAGG